MFFAPSNHNLGAAFNRPPAVFALFHFSHDCSSLLFLLTGCIENKGSKSNENTEKAIDESIKDFSNLNDLSEEEKEAYQLFIENKELNHLKGFSPEHTVLVYLHSVVNSDTESIYSLTYHNGTSPELYEFERAFFNEST